ncbi:SAM-dependent methyltransferase [Amycolatopsis vastitatis]|uniref:SAM-dependent methyltransferase n=1 Tax=Amycolatopsis vastitatis TaxID=1905142 RepID=UPI003F6A8A10
MSVAGERIPEGVDVRLPSAARVYDWLLGGNHNFDADRAVGEKVIAVLPSGRQVAASNRAFLRRAVRYMITQFLDLGSGIPTVGNVHEVAQNANPGCRVVYVDYDEVAVAHSRLILEGNPNATVVAADLCHPHAVLTSPDVQTMLDFSRPIGLLMVAVFHFVPDDLRPREIVADYRAALPPGSLLALSHLTADHTPQAMAAVTEAMKNSRDPMYFRTYTEVAALFDGEQGGGDDPGVLGGRAAQLVQHPGQGGGDHSAAQGGHEQGKQQAAERLQDLPPGRCGGGAHGAPWGRGAGRCRPRPGRATGRPPRRGRRTAPAPRASVREQRRLLRGGRFGRRDRRHRPALAGAQVDGDDATLPGLGGEQDTVAYGYPLWTVEPHGEDIVVEAVDHTAVLVADVAPAVGVEGDVDRPAEPVGEHGEGVGVDRDDEGAVRAHGDTQGLVQPGGRVRTDRVSRS